jgi:hypothetical protein
MASAWQNYGLAVINSTKDVFNRYPTNKIPPRRLGDNNNIINCRQQHDLHRVIWCIIKWIWVGATSKSYPVSRMGPDIGFHSLCKLLDALEDASKSNRKGAVAKSKELLRSWYLRVEIECSGHSIFDLVRLMIPEACFLCIFVLLLIQCIGRRKSQIWTKRIKTFDGTNQGLGAGRTGSR